MFQTCCNKKRIWFCQDSGYYRWYYTKMTKHESRKIASKKYKALKVRDFYHNRARIMSYKDEFRMLLWNYYIGETKKKSRCTCCEDKRIYCDYFQAGRIVAGGKYNIDNALPICGLCNQEMARTNLIQFKNMRYPELTNSSRWKDVMDKLNKFKSTHQDSRLKDENLFDEEDY